MLKLLRTTPDNPDYRALVTQLDAYLARVDGDDHQFYHQFNGSEGLPGVLVAYQRAQAVGCGALKPYSQNTAEIKRMFTLLQCRGQGVASRILGELEHWARELGYSTLILETGIKQIEAIALYKKAGYQLIPNYGPYRGVANSRCFSKDL